MAYRQVIFSGSRVLYTFAAAALASIVAACSGQPSNIVCDTNSVAGNSSQDCGSGGESSSGGASSTAGFANTGGAKATGGFQSTGGSATVGGSSTTGGQSSTGGRSQGTGGFASTGGQSSSGGNSATGGTQGNGGSSATGGNTSTGGGVATGGSRPTGGTTSIGGTGTGGTSVISSSTGGSNGTGGTRATGGTAGVLATGGAGGAGGATGTCGAPLAGQDPSNPLNPTYYLVDESCMPTPTTAAGFIDVEPVTYTYTSPSLGRVTATSTPTRIFYSFIPAINNPKDSPVFVIFNGGPAGSTTGVLFSFGTGPMTLHVDPSTQDSSPKSNPYNWARLANLLYIDSRQAGFSYGTAADPTNQSQRSAGYSQDNFNFFGDAADFARVILRVLKSQPALQNNPVVIVGESYGGMRTSVMLPMLLDPVSIGQSTQPYFVDPALSQEIQNHFATVFKNEGNVPLSRARIVRQFGWQILIQPGLDFSDQYAIQNSTACDPSYLSTQRLQAMGIPCPPTTAGQAQAGILTNARIDGTSTPALMTPASFQKLLGGIDPTTISGLNSSTRSGAYRLITDDSSTYPYAPSSWTTTQGILPTYDRYYIEQNNVAYPYFQITSSLTQLIGWYFLQNLLDVHTFITRAALDFVIIPEVIPKSFMAIDATNPVVSSVTIDDAQPAGVDRPGEMIFTYRDVPAFGVAAGTTRTVRFPTYINSAHPVTVYQPAEFFADMSAFLAETLPATP